MAIPWQRARRAVIRDAAGIGLASGAYAFSFGAISVAAGLSIFQSCALSLLMFTGASQFAMVAVIAAGGGPWAGAATATLLGVRNALYAMRLSSLLKVSGARKMLAGQFVLDESTAMAIARDSDREGRLAFWATGISVFVFWNLGTLGGAIATHALSDPRVFGLDAAPPAAFLALLAPRLRAREPLAIALVAAGVAMVLVPFVPAGVPLLVAAALVAVWGLTR